MKFEHLEHAKQKFNEVANSQERKGIEKYGHPLDPLDNRDWLEYALEENVDGTKYLIAEQEKRKFIVKKIRNLLIYLPNDVSNTEIHYWLDRLENK